MKQKKLVILLTSMIAFSGVTQAALFDRGKGMIYDDQLNITWLQDANYAATSGYASANKGGSIDPDDPNDPLIVEESGRMSWSSANQWAENLIYEGFSDWRLPTTRGDLVGPDSDSRLFDDDDDQQIYFIYQTQNLHNELGHMYFNNLGRLPFTGVYVTGFGDLSSSGVEICSTLTCPSETIEPFNNIFSVAYWTNLPSGSNGGEFFSFGENVEPGELSSDYRGYPKFAWAVRSGDVAVVPIPSTILLFGSGLIGLLGLSRKKINS